MKKIGIMGSGMVAKALAKGFVRYGYPVKMGTRSEDKHEQIRAEVGDVEVGDFKATAEYGEILVLAVGGGVAKDVMNSLDGAADGKLIIDPTNPIDQSNPPEKGVIRYFTDLNKSLMEDLQESFPQSHFVKAFSIIGSAYMVDPDFAGVQPTMFICGDSPEAREEVSAILAQFGFDVWDMGEAPSARAIEPLAMLWCIPGMRENRWDHALKMIRAGSE